MKYIVTAGGTGGHIMPAIAIIQAIREYSSRDKILFIGTDRGMEEKITRQYGVDFIGLKAMGLHGQSIKNVPKSLLINTTTFFNALKIIRNFSPDWVIGTGGYITGMVVLAGKILGISCAIHEQNSIPGLTNTILAKMVDKVFLAFPDPKGLLGAHNTLLTGNPLRKQIIETDPSKRGDKLIIMGGSQGARSINKAAVKAVYLCMQQGLDLSVIHQTGSADYAWVKKDYQELGLNVEVYDFIDDMACVYNKARLVISRAGGLSLAELSRLGIPAILVPYPYATQDHQMHNALFTSRQGGGWIIPDRQLTAQRLALEIKTRFQDSEGLKRASMSMKQLHLGNGSEKIVQEIHVV